MATPNTPRQDEEGRNAGLANNLPTPVRARGHTEEVEEANGE